MTVTKFIPLIVRTEAGLPQLVENTARLIGRALMGTDPGQRLRVPTRSGAPLSMTASPASHRRYTSGSTGPSNGSALSGFQQTRSVTTMQPCLNEPGSESKSESNFKDSLTIVLNSIKEKYPEFEGKDFVGIFWGLQDPSFNNIDGIPATDSDLDPSIERSNSSLVNVTKPSFHGGHRPGNIVSNHENHLSGNQQKRSIVTIMPPLDEPKFEDNFKDFFNLILKKEYPGMADPEWVGAHATSSKNMEGIMQNGFDFSRCGTNWYGYSKFGPGLYTTHDPFHMVLFATEAAKGKSDADMKNALQLAMVFRSGPDEGEVDVDAATTLPTLSDDDQPDPARDIIIGKWVPSEVALSKSTRYMMVPLPPFSKFDGDNIKTWLEEGLQKAGLTQALKTEPDK